MEFARHGILAVGSGSGLPVEARERGRAAERLPYAFEIEPAKLLSALRAYLQGGDFKVMSLKIEDIDVAARMTRENMDRADYLFHRKNPRGAHKELWNHALGCRRWFGAERDTVTYKFASTWKLSEGSPEGEG